MIKRNSPLAISITIVVVFAVLILSGWYFGRPQTIRHVNSPDTPEASHSDGLITIIEEPSPEPTILDPSDPAYPLLQALESLSSYVYTLVLITDDGHTTVTSTYRGDVTPGLTIVTRDEMKVETDGVTEDVVIPADQTQAYTLYDFDTMIASTYVNLGSGWTVSTQPIPATHVYAQAWTTLETPALESQDVLVARDNDNGGTYHFHFADGALARVSYVNDDQTLTMEYLLISETPESTFPSEIVDQAVPADILE